MKLALAILCLLPFSTSARADVTGSTMNAFTLCQMMDATGLQSQPCEVGGYTVTVTLDMDASGARTACPQLAKIAKTKHLSFDDGWKLIINSPYSGGQSIAYCKL